MWQRKTEVAHTGEQVRRQVLGRLGAGQPPRGSASPAQNSSTHWRPHPHRGSKGKGVWAGACLRCLINAQLLVWANSTSITTSHPQRRPRGLGSHDDRGRAALAERRLPSPVHRVAHNPQNRMWAEHGYNHPRCAGKDTESRRVRHLSAVTSCCARKARTQTQAKGPGCTRLICTFSQIIEESPKEGTKQPRDPSSHSSFLPFSTTSPPTLFSSGTPLSYSQVPRFQPSPSPFHHHLCGVTCLLGGH